MALTGVIPIQSGGPSGPIGTAQPVEAPDIAGGLAELGAAGMRYAEKQRDQDNRDAVADAHMQVSQAATDLAAYQSDLRANTPDDPTGYTPKVANEVTNYAQKLVGLQSNPVARDFTMRAMASLRTAQIDDAMHWQAQQKVRYRVGQFGKIAENYSSYVAGNPDDYNDVKAGIMQAIEDSALPPEAREPLKKAIGQQLMMAAATGFATAHPELMQKFANNKLGIADPEAALATNSPAAGQIGPPRVAPSADGATRPAAAPGAPGAAGAPGGFDAAFTRILGVEGGYVANDAGRGPSNMGINQAAHPGVDVGKLTQDQARDIYKREYWDALDLDKQPPAAAAFAFDAAVNQGPGFAKRMLEATGGDLSQMLAFRLQRYQQTAQDPAKAGYLPAWTARAQKLATDLGAATQATPTQIAQAQAPTMVDVDPALPVESLPTMNVEHHVDIGFLDELNADQLIRLKTHADALVRKGQAEAQAQVRTLYATHTDMAEHGVIPPAPDPRLLARAYGPAKAAEQAEKFETVRVQATAMAGAATMTSDQLKAQQRALAPPSVDDPDWSRKQKGYDAFSHAKYAVEAARDKDAIGAARDQRLASIAPLDMSDPKGFGDELKNRDAIAQKMHADYGVAGYSPFTKDEASAIAENFHTLPPSAALAFMQSMRANLSPNVYQAGVETFAKGSPTIQAAGEFAGKGAIGTLPDGTRSEDVARMLLEGDRMLRPDKGARQEGASKYTLPPTSGAAGMDVYLAGKLGQGFMGDADTFARVKQGVYAYYAADSAANGVYAEPVYDSGRLDRAIDRVVGQRSKWATGWFGIGGQPVIMPWGYKEDDFRRNLQQGYRNSMDAAGLTGSTVDNPRGLSLLRIDDYHYGLKAGGSTVVGKLGLPVIIDVNPTPANP